mmetsp:Transcript_21745/g.30504  ORF Transcript_21745/g.30504 Transcript_21745/m.30504 type:complete len:362 (-) Transcript_21745:2330-3415(-)
MMGIENVSSSLSDNAYSFNSPQHVLLNSMSHTKISKKNQFSRGRALPRTVHVAKFIPFVTLLITAVATMIDPATARIMILPQKEKSSSAKRIVLHPKPRKAASPVEPALKKNAKKSEVTLQASGARTEALETSKAQSNQDESVSALAESEVKASAFGSQSEAYEDVMLLFYDPESLPQAQKGQPPPPPAIVYDKNGIEVDVSGKEVLFVPPEIPKVEGNEAVGVDGNDSDVSTTTEESSENEEDSSSSSENGSKNSKINLHMKGPQAQDQMIIMGTALTMALLVGALSARRLRSRQFLSFCIENESLEEDMTYDAAYTTQSSVGASSLYDGGGYDTFASVTGESRYGGDLRWRGDLEKFDV